MADKTKKTPLQDPKGKTHEFDAEHAERLLSYPGTVWRELEAEQKPAPKQVAAAPKAEAGK